MGDTQVGWTKHIPTPQPSAPGSPMPGDAPSSVEERLARLERTARRGKIATAVLAGVAVVLIVVVVVFANELVTQRALASEALSVAQQSQQASGGQAEDDEAFDAITPSTGDKDASDDNDAVDGDSSDEDLLRAADLSDILNEKWSNAQRILEARGIDPADLVLVTDDGGMVFDPGNWTVVLVTDLDEPGKVAVHLQHDIDWWF